MATVKAFLWTIIILSALVAIVVLVFIVASIVIPVIAFIVIFMILRAVFLTEYEDEELPPRG